MIEEGCIEGIWCREYKRKKNRKCKWCVEDTDADRAEQRKRTTTRLVSHLIILYRYRVSVTKNLLIRVVGRC